MGFSPCAPPELAIQRISLPRDAILLRRIHSTKRRQSRAEAHATNPRIQTQLMWPKGWEFTKGVLHYTLGRDHYRHDLLFIIALKCIWTLGLPDAMLQSVEGRGWSIFPLVEFIPLSFAALISKDNRFARMVFSDGSRHRRTCNDRPVVHSFCRGPDGRWLCQVAKMTKI